MNETRKVDRGPKEISELENKSAEKSQSKQEEKWEHKMHVGYGFKSPTSI